MMSGFVHACYYRRAVRAVMRRPPVLLSALGLTASRRRAARRLRRSSPAPVGARPYRRGAAFVVKAAGMQGPARRLAAWNTDAASPRWACGRFRGAAARCAARAYQPLPRRGPRHPAGARASTPRASTSRGWSGSRATCRRSGHPVLTVELPDLTQLRDHHADDRHDRGRRGVDDARRRVPRRATAGSGCSGSASAAACRSSRPGGRRSGTASRSCMAFGGHADLPRTLRVSLHRHPAGRRDPPAARLRARDRPAQRRRSGRAARRRWQPLRAGHPVVPRGVAPRHGGQAEGGARVRPAPRRSRRRSASRRGPTWTTSTRATSRGSARCCCPHVARARRRSRRCRRRARRFRAAPVYLLHGTRRQRRPRDRVHAARRATCRARGVPVARAADAAHHPRRGGSRLDGRARSGG